MQSVPTLGFFIALEGGDGTGKTTQSRLLAEWLETTGRDVFLTRQPGGTTVGQSLRAIVLAPETGDIASRTEALIYLADKAEHVHALIRPALADGKVVVTDRYVESMLAYQGTARGLDPDQLAKIADWATEGLSPDLTIVLDIDPREGLTRVGELDRIEAEPIEFHDQVRDHYLRIAAADPGRHVVVSASGTANEVHQRIRSAVSGAMGLDA